MQFPRTEITHQAIKYIEEGIVDYVVLDSHDDVSKAGNPILVLKLTLEDGKGTTCLCSDHIPYMESMRWKIKHSMLSAALDYADKNIDPATAMKGRKGKCKVIPYDGNDRLEFIKEKLNNEEPIEVKEEIELSDPFQESVWELENLIVEKELPLGTVKKWLQKAGVKEIQWMSQEQVNACIKSLKENE